MAVLSLALAAALRIFVSVPTTDRVVAHVAAEHTQQAPSQAPVGERGVPEPDRRDEAASAVPEPTPFLLVGVGLVGLAVSSRRWRR